MNLILLSILLNISATTTGQNDESNVVELLQKLIQIKTINSDPKEGNNFIKGNELELVSFVNSYLKEHGISSQIIKSDEKRGSLIATIVSPAPDAKTIAFMAHIDVVGVDKNYWKVDPFEAVIEEDGYLYGRGAIDDKGMAACIIEMFIKVKKSGLELKKNLMMLLTADEEAGGYFGIKYMTKNMPELFDNIEYVINEGGNIVDENGKLFLNVQGAEKSLYNVIVKARGVSGHSSVPHDKNPIEILSRAIAKISTFRDKPVLLDVIRANIEGKLPYIDDEELKKILQKIISVTNEKDLTDAGNALLALGKKEAFYYNALIRNTSTTTLYSSGVRFNVIPSAAEATVNVRILPGENIVDFVGKMKKYVDMPEVEFEIESHIDDPAPATPFNTRCYEAIKHAARDIWGDQIVTVPHMSTGGTDSKALRKIGINCYGLLPFPLTREDMRAHADNERVKVEHLETGVNFLLQIVEHLNN